MLNNHIVSICSCLLFMVLLTLSICTPASNSYKESHAATVGIESHELLIIKTNIPQENPDINFYLNGSKQNTKCTNMSPDNVYIRFIGNVVKRYMKLQFFFVPTVDNYYAYGIIAPTDLFKPEVTDTFYALQIHLTNGQIQSSLYPTTFNIDYTFTNNHNMLTIDCTKASDQVIATSRVDMDNLYDMYGEYFLNTCTCSGRGTSEDYTNLSTSWNTVKNSIFFSNSNKLPENFLSRFSTYIPSGNTYFDQAIIRYDYILFFKCYDFENFLSRTGSIVNRSIVNERIFFNYSNTDNINLFIIVVSSSVCLLSITILSVLVIKKRKNESG